MIGRRAAVGLAVIAALAVSAVTAVGASAAPSGTTAYTCVKGGTGSFSGAHCLGGTGEFEHKEFKTQTTFTGTNANTTSGTSAARSALLEVTLGGAKTEI